MRLHLLDEHPLVILPTLATAIGLNEAIVLQQVHYWLINNATRGRNFHDGRYWTYNSYDAWQEDNFPWWSYDTVKRTFKKLENMGLFLVGNYNKRAGDRTKWYSIDYKALAAHCPTNDYETLMTTSPEGPIGQNAPSNRAKCTDQECKMPPPLPETSPEISSDDDAPVESEIAATVDNSPDAPNQSSSICFAEKEKELTEEIRSYCDMSILTEEELQKAAVAIIEEYPDVPLVAQVGKWAEHFQLEKKPVTGRLLPKLQGWMKHYDPDQDTDKLERESREKERRKAAEQVFRSCPGCDSGYIGQVSHKSPTQCNDCGRWWMLEDCEEVETPANMIPRKAYCPHCDEQNGYENKGAHYFTHCGSCGKDYSTDDARLEE